MSKHEYLVANTTHNCYKILGWIINGEAQIQNMSDRTYSPPGYTGLEMGRVYRREVPKCLTDPEEIYRASTLGIGQVQLNNKGEWYKSKLDSVDEARESLNQNNMHRIKPGCSLPPKYALLTDPEEISRGSKAEVVEVSGPHIADWETCVPLEKGDVISCMKRGNTYRLKPGWTIPPKKVQKWVNREPKDFRPLVGKWWWKYKEDDERHLLITDHFRTQQDKVIAKLGTEDWEPMQKVVEE